MGNKGPIKLKDIDRAGSVDVEQEYDFIAYRGGVLKDSVEKYGQGNVLDAVFNMDAKILSLESDIEILDSLVDWDEFEEEDDEDTEDES